MAVLRAEKQGNGAATLRAERQRHGNAQSRFDGRSKGKVKFGPDLNATAKQINDLQWNSHELIGTDSLGNCLEWKGKELRWRSIAESGNGNAGSSIAVAMKTYERKAWQRQSIVARSIGIVMPRIAVEMDRKAWEQQSFEVQGLGKAENRRKLQWNC